MTGLKKEKFWALANHKGQILTDFNIDAPSYFNSDDLATVRYEGKYGIINKEGKIIIPLEFDNKFDFSDNYLNKETPFTKVQKEDKVGIFSKTGKNIVPIKFFDVEDYYGQAFVTKMVPDIKKEPLYGLYSLDGKQILDCNYNDIAPRWDGYVFRKDNYYGFVDSLGNEIIPCEYTDISFPGIELEGVFIEPEKSGFQVIIEKSFQENNTELKKYGAFNVKTKEMILPVEYDNISIFGKDLVCARDNEYKIFYDGEFTSGYDTIADVFGEYSNKFIYKAGKRADKAFSYGLIDHKGSIHMPFDYTKIEYLVYSEQFNKTNDYFSDTSTYYNNILLGTKPHEQYSIHFINTSKTIDTENFMYSDFIHSETIWNSINYDFYTWNDYSSGSKEEIRYYALRFENKDGKTGLINENGDISQKYDEVLYAGQGTAKVRLDGLWGLIDLKTFKYILPLSFNSIGEFTCYEKEQINDCTIKAENETGQYKYDNTGRVLYSSYDGSIIKLNGKYGFAVYAYDQEMNDEYLKTIIEPQYSKLEMNEYDAEYQLFATNNKKKGVIDTRNEIIIPLEYDKIEYAENFDYDQFPLYLLTKNKKTGLAFSNGKIIVPAQFDKVLPAYYAIDAEIPFIVTYNDKKMGIYSYEGKEIIPCTIDKFETIEAYEEFMKIIKDGKIGLLSYQLKELAPCKYDEIKLDNEGNVLLRKNELWGYYLFYQDTLLQAEYKYAKGFSEGMAPVSIKDLFGYINEKGKMIIEPRFEDAEAFSYGRAAVKKNNQYAYIDMNGETITDFKYQKALQFTGNYAVIKNNDKFGYIDYSGKEIIEPKYKSAYPFSKTTAAVVNFEDKIGIIDQNGNIVQDFLFDAIEPKDEYYEVQKNKQWGIIDIDGKVLIDCEYDKFEDFYKDSENLVKINGKYGMIDSDGKQIIPCQYDYLYYFKDNLALAKKGKYYGYLNRNGEVAIPFQFKEAISFKDGEAYVKIKKETFYINKQGERK